MPLFVHVALGILLAIALTRLFISINQNKRRILYFSVILSVGLLFSLLFSGNLAFIESLAKDKIGDNEHWYILALIGLAFGYQTRNLFFVYAKSGIATAFSLPFVILLGALIISINPYYFSVSVFGWILRDSEKFWV